MSTPQPEQPQSAVHVAPGTPLPPGTPPSPPGPRPAPTTERNTLGIVALIAAAVGFVFACIPGALIVGWVLLPVGFILGVVSLFRPQRKRAGVAAIVLSVVGTIIGLVVFMTVVSGAVDDAFGGPSDSSEVGSDVPADAEPDETEPGPQATDSEAAFEPLESSGPGDSVVELPSGVTSGIVTATFEGSGNFAITTLDASNQPNGELLVNTIGDYSGTTAFGLMALSDAAFLQVTADGDWSLRVEPLSAAPAIALPAEGSGDAVYSYDGEAMAIDVTHDGQGNFVLTQAGGDFPSLLVNEIGAYDGTVPLTAGPALLIVVADGAWTIG